MSKNRVFRVDDELWGSFQKYAYKEERTVTDVLTTYMRHYVNRRKRAELAARAARAEKRRLARLPEGGASADPEQEA